MLKKLSPDELDDVGDFIEEVCTLSERYYDERETHIEDICFSLLYSAISLGLDKRFTIKEMSCLIERVFHLIIKKREEASESEEV